MRKTSRKKPKHYSPNSPNSPNSQRPKRNKSRLSFPIMVGSLAALVSVVALGVHYNFTEETPTELIETPTEQIKTSTEQPPIEPIQLSSRSSSQSSSQSSILTSLSSQLSSQSSTQEQLIKPPSAVILYEKYCYFSLLINIILKNKELLDSYNKNDTPETHKARVIFSNIIKNDTYQSDDESKNILFGVKNNNLNSKYCDDCDDCEYNSIDSLKYLIKAIGIQDMFLVKFEDNIRYCTSSFSQCPESRHLTDKNIKRTLINYYTYEDLKNPNLLISNICYCNNDISDRDREEHNDVKYEFTEKNKPVVAKYMLVKNYNKNFNMIETLNDFKIHNKLYTYELVSYVTHIKNDGKCVWQLNVLNDDQDWELVHESEKNIIADAKNITYPFGIYKLATD